MDMQHFNNRLLELATAIEDHTKRTEGFLGAIGFNMANWVGGEADRLDSCGTTACIAGWCYLLGQKEMTASMTAEELITRGLANHDFAGKPPNFNNVVYDWLGVPSVVYDREGRLVDSDAQTAEASLYDLFRGRAREYGNSLESLSISLNIVAPLHAVAVLRHLAKTGTVDWREGVGHTHDASAQRERDRVLAAAGSV